MLLLVVLIFLLDQFIETKVFQIKYYLGTFITNLSYFLTYNQGLQSGRMMKIHELNIDYDFYLLQWIGIIV